MSRVGGLGSVVAYELAAAGVGELVLAHGGDIKYSDLNRQLLMTYERLGSSRFASATQRLHDLNPWLQISGKAENVSEANAEELVAQCDVVVSAAPLFPERFAMHDAAWRQGKPIVECAMFDCEATITTHIPGKTVCMHCLYPEDPPEWKREFPVFGAVSGTVACLGAMEAIKLIGGFGEPLANRMLRMDLRTIRFQTLSIEPRPDCAFCGGH